VLKLPATVVDTNGQKYELSAVVGGGGQGDVYSTKNGRFAVKVLHAPGPASRSALQNRIARLRQLDLDGVPIARPLASLREPHAGYVMKMLDGMASLSSLAHADPEASSPLTWYQESGGLVGRLRILAMTADALNALHSRGLAYGDFSPNNVLVSSGGKNAEVCLIDADNLHQESAPGHKSVYTPRFGAPELVRLESGPSSQTDAHAFAVTAFDVLCVTHPLLGDAVAAGEPELEVAALEGRLPWIDHPSDRSNEASTGLPREIVLSDQVRLSFDEAFTHGLTEPSKRPRLSRWADCLHGAADATLVCPECAASYYHTEALCPWCGAPRPAFVLVKTGVYDPRSDADANAPEGTESLGHPRHHLVGRRDENGAFQPRNLAGVCVAPGQTAALTARHAGHAPACEMPQDLATLAFDGKRLSVAAARRPLLLENLKVKRTLEAGSDATTLAMASGESEWMLHLGDPDQVEKVVHKIAFFALKRGDR
jgi:serine/threonine protein kinase